MPLLDHFHPPLKEIRHWESLHSGWAYELARQLNVKLLPKRFFAEVHSHFGSRIEADVATLQSEPFEEAEEDGGGGGGGGVAVAVEAWAPPIARRAVLDFSEPDLFEVKIYHDSGGSKLVAVIELVSPSNKDRPGNRHAFAVKCGSYLQSGVSVVVVDVVTERSADLHEDILELLGIDGESVDSDLYATAYRRLFVDKVPHLDHWRSEIEVGTPLPTMPLWIAPNLCLPLDLESAYLDTLRSLRL